MNYQISSKTSFALSQIPIAGFGHGISHGVDTDGFGKSKEFLENGWFTERFLNCSMVLFRLTESCIMIAGKSPAVTRSIFESLHALRIAGLVGLRSQLNDTLEERLIALKGMSESRITSTATEAAKSARYNEHVLALFCVLKSPSESIRRGNARLGRILTGMKRKLTVQRDIFTTMRIRHDGVTEDGDLVERALASATSV
jgi:hypothetical protein